MCIRDSSYIMQTFKDVDKPTSNWHYLGVPDAFYDHGKIPSLRKQCYLDKDGICNSILSLTKAKQSNSTQVLNEIVS